jgi:hypothetical protein
MNGVNLATAGHVMNILPPQNITGGVTGQAFSMKGAEHVSIIINFGAVPSPPAAPTAITVSQCTDAAGDGAVALASFRYYYTTSHALSGGDVFNGANQAQSNAPSVPPNWTASTAGITSASGSLPTNVQNLVYVIEIDAAELETSTVDVVGTITELPYLQVAITNGSNAIYASIVAVLTGLRYAYNVAASQTV